jgi:hypothetical protein
MDNLSTHKTDKVHEWAESNNVELVFTPTYASFLNRIECHFSAIGEFVVSTTFMDDPLAVISGRPDSNRRSLSPKPSAIPGFATPRSVLPVYRHSVRKRSIHAWSLARSSVSHSRTVMTPYLDRQTRPVIWLLFDLRWNRIGWGQNGGPPNGTAPARERNPNPSHWYPPPLPWPTSNHSAPSTTTPPS